jgi:quercetin dioxygenase-like cupin family protein
MTTTRERPRHLGSDHSADMTFLYTEIVAGADVHAHRHEQKEVFFVIDGTLEVRLGEQTALVVAGDAVVVPGGEEHAARAVSACRVLVVDYPVRESVGGVSILS